jgi:hypothetical protein
MGEIAQRLAGGAGGDEEEAVVAIEVTGTDADDGFDDHVAQEVEPEAAQVICGQRTDALIAFEGAAEKGVVMKAGEEREVVHGIAADGVVEVDEGGDLSFAAEDVPEGEVFNLLLMLLGS